MRHESTVVKKLEATKHIHHSYSLHCVFLLEDMHVVLNSDEIVFDKLEQSKFLRDIAM